MHHAPCGDGSIHQLRQGRKKGAASARALNTPRGGREKNCYKTRPKNRASASAKHTLVGRDVVGRKPTKEMGELRAVESESPMYFGTSVPISVSNIHAIGDKNGHRHASPPTFFKAAMLSSVVWSQSLSEPQTKAGVFRRDVVCSVELRMPN